MKTSDVRNMSVVFHPVADCHGPQGVEMCDWTWRPTNGDVPPGAARNAAKVHLLDHPTHYVDVTSRTVYRYYVPADKRPEVEASE